MEIDETGGFRQKGRAKNALAGDPTFRRITSIPLTIPRSILLPDIPSQTHSLDANRQRCLSPSIRISSISSIPFRRPVLCCMSSPKPRRRKFITVTNNVRSDTCSYPPSFRSQLHVERRDMDEGDWQASCIACSQAGFRHAL